MLFPLNFIVQVGLGQKGQSSSWHSKKCKVKCDMAGPPFLVGKTRPGRGHRLAAPLCLPILLVASYQLGVLPRRREFSAKTPHVASECKWPWQGKYHLVRHRQPWRLPRTALLTRISRGRKAMSGPCAQRQRRTIKREQYRRQQRSRS